MVTKCLKLRLLHAQTCSNTLHLPQGEQYLELPCGIATETGIPNKSLVTSFYRNRYQDNVFIDTFPTGWLPDIYPRRDVFN